jgi:hypothetical protein
LTTVSCDISFNSATKTSNNSILWGVAGQWRIFWGLGEIGQALVLAALSGLDRGTQTTTTHNVHTVAGAVLAHALVKAEPNFAGYDPFTTLTTVITVFDSQPSLLVNALDRVVSKEEEEERRRKGGE